MMSSETYDRHRSEAVEDENYFVSMTDMMVGILFIFIIMLMIFALNFRTQTDANIELSAEQIEQLNRANDLAEQIAQIRLQIAQEIGKLNEADQARSALLSAIKSRLDKVGLTVTIDKNTGVLRLTEDAIYFPSNRSELDEAAQVNVDKIAKALIDVLPKYSVCTEQINCLDSTGYVVETVFIEGHTDTIGSDERNWKLSTERAVNTYRRIVENFPALRALRNSHGQEILSVSGYAFTRPAIEQDNEEAYRKNRRIDLRFVMEADRRERLTHIAGLLDDMAIKVDELRSVPRDGNFQPSKSQDAVK